jgi:hypothetical protein
MSPLGLSALLPVLRRDSETKQGPHRSATPESTHMQDRATPLTLQQSSTFVREGFVTFTPAQANMVLRECRYERQRDESKAKAHIATLAEYMRRGQWLEKSQIDFARLPTGRLILVNGHHRMHAQILAASNILWSVVIHDCAGDHEVRGLYYRFDTNLRKRSSSNILSGIGFADDAGLKKQTATALWNSAPVILDGLKFKRYAQQERSVLTDDRIVLCRQYLDEARFMETAIAAAPAFMRRKLMSVSVFALAMVTLKHCPEKAGTFWKGLCEDDGLTKGDPRKTLLADMQSRSGGLLASSMMATAKAWNAHYQGRDLKIVKVTGHHVPVSGTPFTVQA